jgi:hypothetical protein
VIACHQCEIRTNNLVLPDHGKCGRWQRQGSRVISDPNAFARRPPNIRLNTDEREHAAPGILLDATDPPHCRDPPILLRPHHITDTNLSPRHGSPYRQFNGRSTFDVPVSEDLRSTFRFPLNIHFHVVALRAK